MQRAGETAQDSHVLFRIPVVADQLAALDSADAETEIAHRCIRPDAISVATRRRVEAAMEAMAPSLADEIAGVCSECGAELPLFFDPQQFCLRELRERAAFIYQDVDLLARRYHWSEREILAMSYARRATYVELARQQGVTLAMARTTYFGRIARGAKGAAADAVLSPPKLLFRPTPRLPFTAGDPGLDLIDDDAANQRSSPGIDRKVASRREELPFADQQSPAGDAIEPSRQSIDAGRERLPARDFDAQFSALQTRRPAQTPDTSASEGVATRERGTDAAERRLESVARPDVAHLDAAGQERATKPVVPPTAAQTHATENLEPSRPSSTRRAPLTSAYRPDAASSTSGGLQIGSMEIRIVNPPAPPPVKTANPVKGRAPRMPASAPTRLSRGFGTFGLIQG